MRASARSTSREALTHARRARGAHARGRAGAEDVRPRVRRTSPCSRSTASATTASPSRSSRPSTPSRRAARRSASSSSTSRSTPVVDAAKATESEPLHPDRPTAGHGYREDPRPNVVRSMLIRHGDPDAAGDVSVTGEYELGMQDQAFLGPESGLAVPDGEGGDRHLRRDAVAARRPRAGRPCLALPRGSGAHPPRRRRRRVRRPRGPLDADPLGAARAAHEPAGEDGLQPRGVVHRARAPARCAHPGGAPRDARRPARLRAHGASCSTAARTPRARRR